MAVVDATPGPHVAVLTFPFGTHAAPLLTAVRRFSAAAPDAYFSFFGTAKSNALLFSGAGGGGRIDGLRAYDVTDGVPENHAFSGRREEAIELFLAAAPDAFRGGMAAAEKERGRRISCVVGDAFLWFAAEMAEDMAVPWVAFWTAGPTSVSAHVYTDAIRERAGGSGFIAGREDETLDFIPGFSKVRLRDLPEGITSREIESPFSVMLREMGLKLPHAAAVFINSFEELAPDITNDLKLKFKNFLSIGPYYNLLKATPAPSSPGGPDAHGCMPWLAKQAVASVAYISFGSVAVPPPNELAAVAEALEATGIPFLWSLRDNARAHLPRGFPDKAKGRGMVVPWAPQVDVLAHVAVGVFVTHCGWNSVLESICAGVPMICRPFFGDQPLNGRMVESVWKIGLRVEGGAFTRDGLIKHLDLIFLSPDQGKEMQMRVREVKELAEKAVGPKGSSTENFATLLQTLAV